MRHCFLAVFALSLFVNPLTTAQAQTLQQETGNNTSACTAALDPAWCDGGFSGLTDTQASIETTLYDPPPAHVSSVPLSAWMYSGFNGQFLCEYQPWFDSRGNNGGHINVGYDENLSDVVAGQDSWMISVGCNINFVDFYGINEQNQQFNLTTTNQVYSDISQRSNLKFAVMEDEGAYTGACANMDHDDTVTCIENSIENDMFYVHEHYANASYYWVDGGTFVIGFFGACADMVNSQGQPILNCPTDWETIWQVVNTWVNGSPQNYNFKFIFNFGNFDTPSESNFQSPPVTSGEYGWPQPIHYDPSVDPTTQFCWGNSSESPNCTQYLDTLYCDTVHGSGCENQWASAGQITVGVLYKGFDDINAFWGKDRVIAQQCGQVLYDTANEMAEWFQGNTQYTLPYVQIATWNDYEEGTEIETGVANCYTVTNAQVSGSNLTWQLTASDSYASTKTIHHFTVWWGLPGSNPTLHVAATNIPPTATSIAISDLALPYPSKGSEIDLYVEMVGMPLIINQMSSAVPYTN